MPSAVIYVRVSTPKQADRGESFEVQESICRSFAIGRGYDVLEVFPEPYSGRKEERPQLNAMFQLIEQAPGQIDAVIIRDIDRLTRGGASPYQDLKARLQRNGIELIDTAGLIQPTRNTLADVGFEYDWSQVSPSHASETFAAEQASAEVSRILTRMIGQEIRLVQQGYRTRPAPFGFVNAKIEDKHGKPRTILEPHPVEAEWVRQIFRLRAEGLLSDPDICDRLNAAGFKTRTRKRRDPVTRCIIGTTGGKQLTVKYLQRIVRLPIYCGVVLEKWTNYEPIRAPYPGLVSFNRYNQANRGARELVETADNRLEFVEGKERLQRQKDNPLYPFRFVVRCPHCGKSFWGSAARGKLGKRYPGYHCSRGHKYFRVTVSEMNKVVGAFTDQIQAQAFIMPLLERIARDTWQRKHQECRKSQVSGQQRKEEVQAEQRQLMNQLTQTESPVVQRLLEEQIEELDERLRQSTVPKKDLEQQDLEQYLKRVRQMLEHPRELLLDGANQQKLQQTWSFVFESLPTFHDLSTGTPKLSFLFGLLAGSNKPETQMVALLNSHWKLFCDQATAGCQIPWFVFRV